MSADPAAVDRTSAGGAGAGRMSADRAAVDTTSAGGAGASRMSADRAAVDTTSAGGAGASRMSADRAAVDTTSAGGAAVDRTSVNGGSGRRGRVDVGRRRAALPRVWAVAWPKLLAAVLVVVAWQVVVWTGWKPQYTLPPPAEVARELAAMAGTGAFWSGLLVTARRAVVGFGVATLVGLGAGLLIASSRVLRRAVGSMTTALQTMPSIAWFPLAILLFQLTEGAIQFVVVLGAAPSIANGVIAGVDYVPPLLRRAGRNLGATGFALYRHVIAPASLPAIVAGLKQGWAFAWRSLMAGELLVVIPEHPSIGTQLQFAREFNQASRLIAVMVVIFVLGILVDVAFNAADRAVRRRWGII